MEQANPAAFMQAMTAAVAQSRELVDRYVRQFNLGDGYKVLDPLVIGKTWRTLSLWFGVSIKPPPPGVDEFK